MGSEGQKTMSAVCSNCGGQLEIDGLQETIVCPYCGTKYSVSRFLNESDTVRAERIKSQAYKEVENEKMKHEEERRKREEEKAELDKFKKGKFSKLLIVFTVLAVLLCLLAFSNRRILAGIIAGIMAGFYMVSYLMGLQVIREKRKGIHILIAIIAFILFIPYFKLNVNGNHSGRKSEQIEWATIEMHELLPEPKSDSGEILSNSSVSLSVDIEGTSNSDYMDYVNQCEAMGYTLDKNKTEMNFDAYNEKGYKLNLFYYEHNEQLSIKLDAPRKMNEFQWPDSGPGSMLPTPKSNQGEVSADNSEQYSVYVGGTSTEEYKNYVKICSDKGFNVDYNNTDTRYLASNAEGYKLTLSYEGFNTMRVSIDAPEKENVSDSDSTDIKDKSTAKATATPKPKKNSKNNVAGVSPEFKKAMDSYEDFFDEYITFMKKYADSDDVQGMYKDYLTYLEKYTDMMQELSEINQSELSTADAAYYLKVYNRIMKKISEAGI